MTTGQRARGAPRFARQETPRPERQEPPRPARRRGRLGACLVGALAALPLAAAPAAAHTGLTSVSPANGTHLEVAPTEVRLQFDSAVSETLVAVVVQAPDGTDLADGRPLVAGGTVVQHLPPLSSSGDYTVQYRVMAADGHPVTGSVSFTLDVPPASGSAAPAARPGEDDDSEDDVSTAEPDTAGTSDTTDAADATEATDTAGPAGSAGPGGTVPTGDPGGSAGLLLPLGSLLVGVVTVAGVAARRRNPGGRQRRG